MKQIFNFSDHVIICIIITFSNFTNLAICSGYFTHLAIVFKLTISAIGYSCFQLPCHLTVYLLLANDFRYGAITYSQRLWPFIQLLLLAFLLFIILAITCIAFSYFNPSLVVILTMQLILTVTKPFIHLSITSSYSNHETNTFR